MKFNKFILFLFISIIICNPPSKPQPTYEIFTIEPSFKKGKNRNSSNFKILEENSQGINSTNVIVTILKNGCIEEHEINITSYSEYSFYLSFSNDQSLELISNECFKINPTKDQPISDDCSPSFEEDGYIYFFL